MAANYRSPEQLLERYVRDMGEDLGRVYDALTNELTGLHVKWNLYRQLYGRSPARIDLLNRTAGYFFWLLQRVLVDDVLLHLGRLTDSERTGGRENLTVQRLPVLVPGAVRTEVEALLTAAMTACQPVRPWRNRRLAHTDLESRISNTPLPGITIAQIEAAVTSLRVLLNRVEIHYWKAPTLYEETIIPPGDVDSLVYYLMKGVREDERRHQRLRDGRPLPEDLERDDIP